VDGGVLAVLAGWAVVGPMTDDDGFATMIARNAASAGDQGNYYRWWNASEAPFALAQQVLSQLTEASLTPLWLRVPSTVMGAAVWFTLTRGVLGAVPGLAAHRVKLRLLAAACFLAAWLPYDLGVRPEPYVALGLASVLALLWRARTAAGLGAAALAAALTMTVGPSGLLVLAPVAVFAGKVRRILRDTHAPWLTLVQLAGIGAIGLTVVFADQTLHGVLSATDWHTTFGPSLPWSEELERYRFLLGPTQDGTAAKRVPVLLAYALLPVVGIALARRGDRDPRNAACARLAGVAAIALGLLWLTPSKWSHHFGALAGFLAAFLVVGAVTLRRHAREQPGHRPLDRTLLGTGLVGVLLVAVAAGLAFAGPNAWWQPVSYLVWWPDGPVRPLGLPLDSPVLWLALALGGAALVRLRSGEVTARVALAAAPGTLAVAVAGTAVAVLLASFAAAPLRRPEASLAAATLDRLAGGPSCGLADEIQVLPDVPGGVLAAAPGSGPDDLTGFAEGAGFGPSDPPPQPPGTGASARTWGSRVDGPAGTGRLVSSWFTLPPLAPDQELAMTVSGRTDEGNGLSLEFGRAGGGPQPGAPGTPQSRAPGTPQSRTPVTPQSGGAAHSGTVTPLGEREPIDQPHHDPAAPPEPAVWRSVWLPTDQVPAGADRVRVVAVDGSAAEDGWLALTGPRLRQVVGLTDFLAGHGPVLVNWPIAFLFPCVRDVAGAAGGLAETPRTVLEAPGRYAGLAAATTAPEVGGDFAVLRTLGRVGEVPSRVVGHPELDWGSVRLAGYGGLARDLYQVRREMVRLPGWVGDRAQFVSEGEKSPATRGRQ
jgi:arabinosyltransferase C